MNRTGRSAVALFAAVGLLAVGYALGRGSAPAPAGLPAVPVVSAPAPTPSPDTRNPEVEDLRREVARLEAEIAGLRAASEPPPDRLDHEALADVSRRLDERFARELQADHPELKGLQDEYARVRSDMVAAPDGPGREALVARVAELRSRVNAIREPYHRAADHTKTLLRGVGRVGLTAEQMDRIAEFAYPRNRELEIIQADVRERIAALRRSHPEIERAPGWEDVTPKYRELDPDLDRALSRIREIVLDYHATWKGMLTDEQRARLAGGGR